MLLPPPTISLGGNHWSLTLTRPLLLHNTAPLWVKPVSTATKQQSIATVTDKNRELNELKPSVLKCITQMFLSLLLVKGKPWLTSLVLAAVRCCDEPYAWSSTEAHCALMTAPLLCLCARCTCPSSTQMTSRASPTWRGKTSASTGSRPFIWKSKVTSLKTANNLSSLLVRKMRQMNECGLDE